MRLTELNPSAWTVSGFLDPAECRALIDLAEHAGFAAAGVRTRSGEQSLPMIRNNERTLVEDAGWVARLWDRLSRLALPVLDGASAVGLPKDLRFYKYQPGHRFKMHKDGPWHENNLTSRLTFLVYLNDDFTGGSTDFKGFQVVPATGAALIFVHDTWHEGSAVVEGTKYVLRSDILYAVPYTNTVTVAA